MLPAVVPTLTTVPCSSGLGVFLAAVWLAPGPLLLTAPLDAAGHQAVLPARVEVGEQDGDRLADEAAPVEDEPEAAQPEPRVLQVEQLGGGQVDGDLLVVSFPAGRLAFIGGAGRGAAGRNSSATPGTLPGVTVPVLAPPLENLLGEFTV